MRIKKKMRIVTSNIFNLLKIYKIKNLLVVRQLKEYIEDSILSEIEKASDDPVSSDNEETFIEAVYDEEAKLNNLPAEEAKNKAHFIIHKYAADIADRISKKAARKITKNSDLKSAVNEKDKKEIIKKNVEKVVKKVVKKDEKKASKKAKGRISSFNLVVKSTKNLLTEENLDDVVDVVSELYK